MGWLALRVFALVFLALNTARVAVAQEGILSECLRALVQGDVPSQFLLPSKTASRHRDRRGRMFRLQDGTPGMVLNGKHFPDFELVVLPRTGVPVAIINPTVPPIGQLIVLHGLGYSISTVFSVTGLAEALAQIGSGALGEHPLARWFAKTYPELQLPLRIVLVDVPPMGWAPPIDRLPGALDVGDYIGSVTQELNEYDSLPTLYLGRSAGGPLGLLASHEQNVRGVIITGATFPDRPTVEANIEQIRYLEQVEGESPNWEVIDWVVDRFLQPEVLARIKSVGASGLPILSVLGSEDKETPKHAQDQWALTLNLEPTLGMRSQIIISGAGHQVFLGRPRGENPIFHPDDPDVQAYRTSLEFLKLVLQP